MDNTLQMELFLHLQKVLFEKHDGKYKNFLKLCFVHI